MCCFFAVLVLIGPRAAILVWWLVDMERWERAIDNFFFAFLGFLFVPWFTLAWVAVASGGVTGFDWVILGLGLFADFLSYSGSAWGNRGYSARYA